MTNKTFIPSTFHRSMYFGAVLLLDLNNSTGYVGSQWENYRLFKDRFQEEVIKYKPKDCCCEVLPLTSGDCHKVTAHIPCDFIQHFNAPRKAAKDTIIRENLSCLNDIIPNVGSIGMGQILEIPSSRYAKSMQPRDDNHGLAFCNADNALRVLKGNSFNFWFSTNYLNVSSIFPPVDLLLNVSSALWAKKEVLGLMDETVSSLQRQWLGIIQEVFVICKAENNWSDVDENCAVFSFNNSQPFIQKFNSLLDFVKKQIQNLLVTYPKDTELFLALDGLLKAVDGIHLSNVLLLSKFPLTKRGDFSDPDDMQKRCEFERKAEEHNAVLFHHKQVCDARKPIMRFLSIAT